MQIHKASKKRESLGENIQLNSSIIKFIAIYGQIASLESNR